MKTYSIYAHRSVRALYYATEYGVRKAVELLSCEPKIGEYQIRTIGGMHKKNGVFTRKYDAMRYRDRVLVMAANAAGKLGRGPSLCDLVEVR